ncbi:MAG: tetratricopeptide repeat protein, partial [Planctomycetota bacterium]
MLNRFCFTPVLLFAALVIPSCVSDPAGESGTSASRTANPGGEPIRLTDVPPPPGVPPIALTPYDESQTAKADMSRQQAIATLAAPRYLDQLGQAPEPRDTTPPLAAQKFYAAGKQALLENDNFRAVQQLEKALRLSPGEPAILRSLAEAWTRAGNRVSASNFYRQAFAADPTDLDSVFMLGRFALDERRWDQAILNLDAALQLAAPNPEANDNANGETPASPRTADPVATHLIHYYLANALNQAGYGKAAAEMFNAYLAGRPRLSGISTYAR